MGQKFALFVLIVATLLQAAILIRDEQQLPVGFSGAGAWMRSAECARKTGKLLVVCDKGVVQPFAEHSAGDDPGPVLALGVFTAVSGLEISTSAIPVLNTIVNVIGLFCLAGLLWWLRLPFVAMTLLALGPILARSNLYFTPHTAQLGETCLAMIAPIVVLTTNPLEKRTAVAWIVGAIIFLALASLFRQSLGLMGFAAGALAVGYKVFVVRRTLRNLALYTGVMVALFAAYKAPAVIFEVRNAAYGLPQSEMMETHGVWHNLYIGLGAVRNPFNIEWLDDSGFQHAKAIDPSVRYVSNRYYEILKGAYFGLVVSHPLDVVKIYFLKFVTAVESKIWWALLASALIALTLRRTVQGEGLQNVDAVLAVSIAFSVFFLAQSVLFIWRSYYIFPVTIALFLILGASIEVGLAFFRRRRTQVATA